MTRTRPCTVLAAFATVLGAAGCVVGDSGSRALPWSLVSASGRTLVISYSTGGCERDPRTSVRESRSALTVTMRVRVHRGACTLRLVTRQARVVLPGPLGRRRLLDGATGDPPPTAPPLPARLAPP